VLAWHKTATTSDIQQGVERAIAGVLKKAAIPPSHVDSVKIGTTVKTLFLLFGRSESNYGLCRVLRLSVEYAIGEADRPKAKTYPAHHIYFNASSIQTAPLLHGRNSDVL
jgi:hypothetical protein